MKVKVKASDISRAIKQCVSAIDPKDAIRSNIQFEAENGIMRLKATNIQYSIERTFPCNIQEDGVAVVDGKMAYSVISKANNECELISDSNSMIIRTSGRTKLPNICKDIPMIDDVSLNSNAQKNIFDAIEFKSAIQKVDYAISEDQSRMILTGAHIVTDGHFATITALDGFRLAQVIIPCEGDAIDIIVPSRILSSVCDAITDGNLTITTNRNHVSFKGDGFLINAVTLSGDYIDTSRIIPTEHKINVLIKTTDIKDCADSATVASGTTNLVKLEITKDRITVKSNSEEADFQGDIDAIYDGDAITIAFNLRYLIQSIAHISTEQCELKLNSPIAPAIFVPHGDKNELHLILPVRVFS